MLLPTRMVVFLSFPDHTAAIENKWNETAWAKKLAARAKKAAISAVSRSALRRRTKRSWRGQTNGVLCLFVTMHRFRDSYGQKGVWKGEGESDLIVLPTRMGNRCDVG